MCRQSRSFVDGGGWVSSVDGGGVVDGSVDSGPSVGGRVVSVSETVPGVGTTTGRRARGAAGRG